MWQELERGGRVYALHLKGIQVAEDGRFLGMKGEAADERSPLEAPQTPPAPSPELPRPADAARLAQLEAEVRALTQIVQALAAALAGVEIAPSPAQSTVAVEESKVAAEASKAPTAESKAVGGGKCSTSYTDTPDTSQTPATDTRTARLAAGGGADALPDDLRQALQALDFRGRRPLAELATAYQTEPARVGGWIQHVSQHRAEYHQPASFLLQSVVRESLALPVDAIPASNRNGVGSTGPCAVCGGPGVVTLNLPPDDPDHGRTIPCPRCGGPSQFNGTTAVQKQSGVKDDRVHG